MLFDVFQEQRKMLRFMLILSCFSYASALDNGLALTPPMGWLSWARFICNVDCENDPYNCISETLYMEMADHLVADGFKDVGYEYVNIDDCWMDKMRDSSGKLKPDSLRFPNGIKKLADYVHSKGLKLGIYIDCGNKTCAGYPGSYGYYETDALTFAEWGIDMLKVDGCYADPKAMDILYPKITNALNQTGRPIVFSCSWPDYQQEIGIPPNYQKIAKYCNLWRNFDDIEDSWQSVLSIIDYYALNQEVLIAAAGPGHWNDPDMIIGGNFGLSYEEAKSQFALWAIMASPLLMSNDLRVLNGNYKTLFTNKEIIAVNQDLLGMMGKRIYANNNIEIWTRPITPVSESGKYSFAVVFFNRRTLGGPVKISVQFKSIGLDNSNCYIIYDVFTIENKQICCPSDNHTVIVNPSGIAMIIAKNIL